MFDILETDPIQKSKMKPFAKIVNSSYKKWLETYHWQKLNQLPQLSSSANSVNALHMAENLR